MRKVRIHTFVEDGVKKIIVASYDPEGESHEVLRPDGEWVPVSPYIRNADNPGVYTVPETLPKELTA